MVYYVPIDVPKTKMHIFCCRRDVESFHNKKFLVLCTKGYFSKMGRLVLVLHVGVVIVPGHHVSR